MAEIRVEIPGDFIATYEDGAITRMVFVPHAGAAGYFGPAAYVETSGPGLEIDVEDTDGPFWRAMQAALPTMPITWEE